MDAQAPFMSTEIMNRLINSFNKFKFDQVSHTSKEKSQELECKYAHYLHALQRIKISTKPNSNDIGIILNTELLKKWKDNDSDNITIIDDFCTKLRNSRKNNQHFNQ